MPSAVVLKHPCSLSDGPRMPPDVGLLGRHSAHSALLYRSFFPTVMTRWWAEAVLGVHKVQ